MPVSISRRSFTRFSMVALTGLLGLTAAPIAHAEGNLAFQLYSDKAGEFRWRLKGGNGEILATAGQGYKAKASARASVERIKKNLDELVFETYEDAKKETRWRLKSKNGQVVASSSEGYSDKSGAERAIERIKSGAKDASVSDEM